MSYKFSHRFESILSRSKTSPPIPKKDIITDPDLDTVKVNEGTAPSIDNAPDPPGDDRPMGGESESNPKTPSKGSEPSTSPNHNFLSMSELRGEKVPKSLSEEFTDASFEHLLAKSNAYENFFHMKMDQYMATKDKDNERKRVKYDQDPKRRHSLALPPHRNPKMRGTC